MRKLLTLSEAVLTTSPYNFVPSSTDHYHTSTRAFHGEEYVTFAEFYPEMPTLQLSAGSLQTNYVRCFRRMPA
ncbi:hypothetical protein SAMN05428964_11117 [Thalassospira xiamenensis]|uniref:Uncharacterized protein n=1 Tax=Thalassospira xiamenensis TaxID=220697 RepID=A0A285U222_9PROT|nr:hypothetical protein SAMN05428964_11117 [Thalassospira xiamenensis]